jgi:ATPase subunit of ABC transporter with duplicated ATPase domains
MPDGQILLIVNGHVESDDGNILRTMLVRIGEVTLHLDRLETQTASRRFVEAQELAAFRADVEALQTQLSDWLMMRDFVVVKQADIDAMAAAIRHEATRISGMLPDDPPQGD